VIHTPIKVQDRVRTLVAVGPKLPQGSVGVVVSVDKELYKDNLDGSAYLISVVFPQLLTGGRASQPVEGIALASVPLTNAVPFKVSELERIDSLVTEGGN
jgi:hypothetical protein